MSAPDDAPPPTSADRAAARSLRIGIWTLIIGAFAWTYFAMQRHDAHHNEKILAVPLAMLLGHAWGMVEAIRALAGQTIRRSQVTIALLINGGVGGILLLLVVVMLIGVGVWSGMGR